MSDARALAHARGAMKIVEVVSETASEMKFSHSILSFYCYYY